MKNQKIAFILLLHVLAGIIVVVTSTLFRGGYWVAYVALFGLVITDGYLLTRQCVKLTCEGAAIFTPWTVSITISLLIAGGVFVWAFLSNDQEIKQYDSTVYWIKVIEACDYLSASPVEFLIWVRNSLAGEYSNIAALPLIPIYILFQSFCGFGISIYVVYYVPMCLLAALYVSRIISDCCQAKAKVAFIVTVGAGILMVPMIYPLLCGYVDVSGLVLILLLMHLSLNKKLWDAKVLDCVCYILLSILLVYTRRWYSFLIVAFYFSIGVEWLLLQIKNRKIDWKQFIRLMGRLIAIAATCALLMLMLSSDSLKMFFRGDYAIAYSAYKLQPWYMDLKRIIQISGLWYTAIAVLGFLCMLFHFQTRLTGLKMLVMIATAITLFERIQSMGSHHSYMVLLFVLLFYSVGFTFIITCKRALQNMVIFSLSAGIMLINFSQSFLIENVNYAEVSLVSNLHYRPKPAEAFSVVHEVYDDLAELTQSGGTFYVCSNSEYMSSELITRSKLPAVIDATPNMVENSIVDLRDGFPSQLFFADYIVTASDETEGQHVVLDPIQLLETNAEYAEVYEVVKTYQDDNQKVVLYKKNGDVTKELVSVLSAQLRDIYPDYDYVYQPDYYVSLMKIHHAQKIQYDPWEILASKEQGVPLTIEWNLSQEFESIECQFANWMSGLSMKVYSDEVCIYDTIMSDAGNQQFEFDTRGTDKLKITFGSADDQLSGVVHLKGGSLVEANSTN